MWCSSSIAPKRGGKRQSILTEVLLDVCGGVEMALQTFPESTFNSLVITTLQSPCLWSSAPSHGLLFPLFLTPSHPDCLGNQKSSPPHLYGQQFSFLLTPTPKLWHTTHQPSRNRPLFHASYPCCQLHRLSILKFVFPLHFSDFMTHCYPPKVSEM